ncbi:DMT family transporter [Corynebacterium sanguinis]|uniref:DMT family transporter n=1 Tax=Corynebacterium sanguinis TaxID=2594913 RepID=UPI0011A76661|nr:DMT family transporter [Corynebacterium sanguinis]MCT1462811.1 DMT family transporter [Corynebacterium sanguinis]MCT1804425.1 DMT family transporter [Corynebacterium sanguinis]MCT2157754.1 DMT family transporter [Corynebacterium sanguinis]MCT2329061.1 DMT family transporter [Corynebacterium sanguinis]
MLAILAALAIGSIIPIQTAANSRLRLSVGGFPVVSALISFTVAFLVSVIATAILVGHPVPDFAAAVREPWWVWSGGALGVMFVMGNILLFPRIGAVATVVLPILGQVVMGLTIDQFGLFRAPQLDVGLGRILGAIVVVVGIALVVGVGKQGAVVSGSWAWRAVGVGIGMASAAQTTINGHLGTVAGSSLHAAEINLAVGALLLFAIALVTSPRQLVTRPVPGPWWMWSGGVIGAIFVAGGATLAPVLGTATTVIGINAGTIAGGQVIESMGWFGVKRLRVDPLRVVGLVLIFAGVVAVRTL